MGGAVILTFFGSGFWVAKRASLSTSPIELSVFLRLGLPFEKLGAFGAAPLLAECAESSDGSRVRPCLKWRKGLGSVFFVFLGCVFLQELILPRWVGYHQEKDNPTWFGPINRFHWVRNGISPRPLHCLNFGVKQEAGLSWAKKKCASGKSRAVWGFLGLGKGWGCSRPL